MDLTAFADRRLWDLIDHVSFWVKDRAGCFVWVNRNLAEQAQASRAAIIGTKDSDWFFNELADVYMDDDFTVLKTQQAIINKPELVMSADGEVVWHATSKFPYVDVSGAVAGTYGMSQPMVALGDLPAEYVDLSLIVSYAREHLTAGVTVEAMARKANMSLSTLERTVARHLKITPLKLLQRMRMHRARHLLTTSHLKVGEIALDCGYESFSSFSRAFRQSYGCAPGRLRSASWKPAS
ncbi:helix-turn-helix domain-containing protein [Coraliomargarita algicola]|uniref:Helix-turn-helix domain-containing protein n=1 Tax=Coraliomargarita algicola TaxID=3092156 RepID=A0ABZ0RI87_9BACT|nr:helix-turn-helix domain-containing protein [Coraliomargarita sp. J2-16]WPJ95086.1 helix-turn-helix domain-containing protein [Coraliomargarita sp. J2-16]